MSIITRCIAVAVIAVGLSGCSDGALGFRGSPAWYMTASKEAIQQYEASGKSRSSSLGSYSYGSSPNSTKTVIGSQNTSYQTIGNTVYGSDGSTHQAIGNTVYSSDGTTHQKIGSTVYSSDGTTHQTIGNTVYSSDGTTHQKIGNTVYSSDGTTCQMIGSQTFCN